MFFKKSKVQTNQKSTKSYYLSNSKTNWSDSSYSSLAKNGYMSNVVANRCINLITKSISSIDLLVYENEIEITNESVNRLIKSPNPFTSGIDFVEGVFFNLLISGNAYIQAVKDENGNILELYSLRPDRMSVVLDKSGSPMQYIYKCGSASAIFDCDLISGESEILHLKNFNPNDDIYGLSPLHTAIYSIDQHNQAISWNKALLENGARPSGALVVESSSGELTDDQFYRLKDQIHTQFTGAKASGKVMILEGGLKWQEMSMSPRDMDFIETKNSAARDIALAFGVPSNLLGIHGDNTYSNFSEARIAFWEETVIPMTKKYADKLSHWLNLSSDRQFKITPDVDSISILTEKRYQIWDYVNKADFLSPEEKRKILGF